eukprot:909566-Rhodomonas_salina.1
MALDDRGNDYPLLPLLPSAAQQPPVEIRAHVRPPVLQPRRRPRWRHHQRLYAGSSAAKVVQGDALQDLKDKTPQERPEPFATAPFGEQPVLARRGS